MALLDQGWIIFISCCCILGISLWTGVNAMTVKLMFLWTFIAFGFLTLILHVFGSSVIKLLSRLKSAVLQPEASAVCCCHCPINWSSVTASLLRLWPNYNCEFSNWTAFVSPKKEFQAELLGVVLIFVISEFIVHSEEDLVQRRQKATKKKQVLQDDKTQFFQETVLQPRKDAELERKNADFYRFGKLWRGPGYKLKSEDLSESADGENEIDANSYSKVFGEEEVSGDTLSTEGLRHRKSDKHKQTKMDDYYQQVITVALRCPNGKVNKRRFTLESQIQGLVTFAAYLGFPPSQYVILKTYPRESLSNVTQTFQEAGLTHDVALVIEEL